jgi:hypothetical protein
LGFKVVYILDKRNLKNMENSTKKSSFIIMILGGVLVLGNYSLKLINEEKHTTNNIIIICCSLVFICTILFAYFKGSKKV